MSARAGGWLSLLLMWACTSATARERPQERQAPRDLRHIDEAFTIGTNSCTVDDARERVSEVKIANPSRATSDLRVLELAFRCRTASEQPISFEQALPKDALVLLVDSEGATKAPSTRTWLHSLAPEHVFFELDENERALPRPRRYHAKNGALKPDERTRSFELWMTGSLLSTRLRFTKALDRAPLEQSLDTLITELANGESTELEAIRKLHRSTRELTQARTLQIDEVTAEGPLRVVSVSYRDLGRPFARDIPRLVLELLPTGRPEAPYQFARARELGALRSLLRCVDRQGHLEASAQRAFAEAPAHLTECNMAGIVWPASCEKLPDGVLREALAAREGCLGEAVTELEKRAAPAPTDLQVTLRRGRGQRALERAPRYTVAIFGSGATVFHSLQRGRAPERRDGRTSPALVAALMRSIDDLDWFGRRGGSWREDCDPHAEEAHVLTVHAGDRERMVLDREGCRGPFSARELSELFDLVERVGFVSTWTMPRPDYADRETRIWTITDE
jgi:hypothetical protein